MFKKVLVLLSGATLLALLAGLVGVTVAFAQEPTPEPQAPPLGRAFGGFRMRGLMGGMFGGGQWTMFDTAAEALGLTPEELFSELHAGKTLAEVADEQGVEMEAVQEALDAARAEAMQEAIEQAVEDGVMSQEQADWLLEGIEKGFAPMGRGFGRGGHGWRGCLRSENADDL